MILSGGKNVKKFVLLLWVASLLCGCTPTENFEIMGDVYAPQSVEARQVSLVLPEDAAQEVMEGSGGTIYFCNGYEIMVNTCAAGDLSMTLSETTGYEKDALTVVQTENNGLKRYDCVWASAGEGGDLVSRIMILDDGNYHYCLSMSCAAEDAGSLQAVWMALTDSFCLA